MGPTNGDFRPVEVIRGKSLNGSKPAEIGHTLLSGGKGKTDNKKVVFTRGIETGSECGGTVKVIVCIEDWAVIEKILSHLNEKAPSAEATLLPESRAPPKARLFDFI